ncbi:aldehyde dehydrogenase [Mycolicibacterium sp.]|uniref:aldehyde dehydrogenase n=1 Tax=Mycolicibacterium sp. TaxID=2320850 RepID=UPI001A1DABDB|nr:aldehyde dehydrogenase [Mycolicibacterium sp.]MBJ7336786.1 aldehyde dehydrogenase [Mycolicibacterium sp.]
MTTGRWDRDDLFVGGRFVAPATKATLDVISPNSEEIIAKVPMGSPLDIDAAVTAARRAFDDGDWRRCSAADRAAVVRAIADDLDKRSDELADVITAEMGAPVAFCAADHVVIPIAALRYYADLIEAFSDGETRTAGGGTSRVWHEPLGVIAAIVPWNAPLRSIMNKLAPALVSGCSIIVKSALETPLDTYPLAEAIERAGVPEGVVSFVAGDAAVGDHLVGHPGIDKVVFTGSTAAGRAIMSRCSERLTPLTLELGGKSAAVLLDDADFDWSIKRLVPMSIGNTGQSCMAQTRMLVPRDRHDEFVEKFVAGVERWPVGDPWDPKTLVGPLVSRRQRDRVLNYLDIATDEGAQVATGGGRPAGLAKGFYVEPTVFTGVTSGMRIAREEVFGPVVAVQSYRDLDDAVDIANDSEYGLAGSVWTAQPELGLAVATRIRAGGIRVNGAPQALDAPFGGFKNSGFGREYGPEGLHSYFGTKAVAAR